VNSGPASCCGPVRRAYRVEGLDCAEETRALKATVGRLRGVQALSFDLLRARMVVTFEEGAVGEKEIVAAAKKAGLRAQPWSATGDARRFRTISTVLSGAATAVGVGLELAGLPGTIAFGIGVAAGMWHVLPKAALAARGLRPDMNLLMTIAVCGAMAIGEWFEASTVAFLFSLSLALEAWSVRRARHAIEALLELAPATARVVVDGTEEQLAADTVETGTLVRVLPGERVPLDGVVEQGESHMDESLLTGESLPVAKTVGSAVAAGSINGEGMVEVRTTKRADESTVAHITRLVEEAGQRGSRSERWVERFARIYTPIVMLLALVVLVAPPLVADVGWAESFYRALVLLVIACPCALVISTPVSIVSSLASAARNGVLVKEGTFVELPARLRTIAVDKTGTITEGRPRVVEMAALEGHSEEDLLARAAAVEAGSEHPLADAIVEAARARGVAVPAARNVRAVRGKGVEGEFDGRPFWVGSHRWLKERGRETEESRARLAALSGAGRSVVLVGNEEHVCGFISVADDIRPEAVEAFAALHRQGIERIVMLTGDNAGTARAIAERVGVDDVRAELLPEDKIAAVEALGAESGPVAMVGDGVNDAPALAMADVGIAMAAAGSDTAIETADIALMTSDLSKLAWLVGHSRRTLAILRENVAGALVLKGIFVLLTFGGYASLWMAIAADMGASLAVVFNALRLLKSR
jgi:Cd2+/Zn2+-exporting ATPase